MLTQKILKELMHYDPLTSEFTWKERDLKWFSNTSEQRSFNTRFAGKIAGSTDNTKSVAKITLLGEHYKPSNLQWLYTNGEFRKEQYAYVPPKNSKFPYGDTDKERQDFARAFSKLAGKMPVSEIAEKINLTEKQVRNFANRSGWSIKHVSNK